MVQDRPLVDAGDSHANHTYTQRPDVVQGHHANSRRRIEATAPPAVLTAEGAVPAAPSNAKQPLTKAAEGAGHKTIAFASRASSKPPPTGKTVGGQVEVASGWVGVKKMLDDMNKSIQDLSTQITSEIGSIKAEIKVLSIIVVSLSDRLDVIEAHLGA